MANVWPTGDEVIRDLAARHRTVMLSFSGGKESVCCWLALRPHFDRVVPVHNYLVPDLGFVERGLRYFEDFFGTPVLRVPHPALYRMLNNFVYQPPERIDAIRAARLPALSFDLIRRGVAAMNLGMDDPDALWVAVGSRAKDSVQRNLKFRRHGPVSEKTRTVFPVWDWDKQRVIDTLKAAGVKLPAEYRLFARTWDGLGYRFLKGIKDTWPDDYRKILAWFPLAEAEVLRYEFADRRRTTGGQA